MLANLAMDDRDLDIARSHFEEAIAAAEEGGFSQALIGGLWNNLGLVLLYQEEFEEAALLSRKALIASRRRGRRTREGAFELYILACCATRTGNYREAAQLTGAHDAIDAEIIAAVPVGAYWWSPFELEVRNDNRARLREALGEIEFAQAYAIGARLNFEEAIDLALVRSAPA
jgi:tetratricopeptide (TPR) repeat protein